MLNTCWCLLPSLMMIRSGGGGEGQQPAWKKELSESSHSWKKALLTQSAQISSRNKPWTHLCWLMSVQRSLKIEVSETSNGEPSSLVDWLHFCWLLNPRHLSCQNVFMCFRSRVYLSIAVACLWYTIWEEHVNLSCVTMSTSPQNDFSKVPLLYILLPLHLFFYWFPSFCPS